jgi:serine/threonine-protein kinase RsbT
MSVTADVAAPGGEALTSVAIDGPTDVIIARQKSRVLAEQLGFSSTDVTLIATAVSEVARNIVEHAGRGIVKLGIVTADDLEGLLVVASDEGPGIADMELALRDGYSTIGGMGLGLPGARRLMSEFRIESSPGAGTTVTMTRWAAERVDH